MPLSAFVVRVVVVGVGPACCPRYAGPALACDRCTVITGTALGCGTDKRPAAPTTSDRDQRRDVAGDLRRHRQRDALLKAAAFDQLADPVALLGGHGRPHPLGAAAASFACSSCSTRSAGNSQRPPTRMATRGWLRSLAQLYTVPREHRNRAATSFAVKYAVCICPPLGRPAYRPFRRLTRALG